MLPAFSLSNRWNVESETSAISSSLSVIGCVADRSTVFGASAAGIVAAEAPIIEKPNPAAPSAGTAAFTARFRLEAGFVCDIKVLHSQKVCADPPRLIVRCTFESCKAGEEFACCNVLLSFIFVNVSDVVPKRNRHNHHGSILFLDRVAFVFRCGVAASVRERLSS
ncbi:hypothetical protein [Bradyrhizobium sp. STM 3843]|uniref:hypothetical protein n=1 Tax=Bradyrhizobium sp. STM 3843 TaxID=551947 RepID=UPI0015860E59|nr:hypothetical protein [Bradyrhizobium sp. STM 3843]